MAQSAALLEARQVTSVRGERTLFEDLNLAVHPGHLYQIEGPNGAGKSSLLRIIAGLLQPLSGDILYKGELRQHVRREFLQDLLFIGHKAAVKPELTALENLEFFAATQGQPCAEPPFELLAQLGLVGLEDVPAANLSAGQQRRIALARLWVSGAALWILDEPFTSLDVAGIALLHRRFDAHLQAGGAIILTSHQPLDWAGRSLVRLQLEYSW
ncbi:heme ABC transporter ATP-binding protein CcmA [Aliidiomarina sedimenti]|uniref:Heme ABC transporter ATP-binding protein CcmA n=1 Tax=Aliidiomarina sedimenti TaxID=1933879 RepID=A0ABY0C078_9GAMM|nr:cytochrome c biogenesis heme-transporting ATPase CcmA [Aliidiomarina sedimenti]RUO30122.1 heme ABC transporter ATP-binding protein CcmA [Aliidiomarina sedimenti]